MLGVITLASRGKNAVRNYSPSLWVAFLPSFLCNPLHLSLRLMFPSCLPPFFRITFTSILLGSSVLLLRYLTPPLSPPDLLSTCFLCLSSLSVFPLSLTPNPSVILYWIMSKNIMFESSNFNYSLFTSHQLSKPSLTSEFLKCLVAVTAEINSWQVKTSGKHLLESLPPKQTRDWIFCQAAKNQQYHKKRPFERAFRFFTRVSDCGW